MSGNEEGDRGLKAVANKAQDLVSDMVGKASAATAGSHDTEAFVANAAAGDLYEIEAARMALQQSRSDGVREFARMMVEHHTTSMHQMQSALSSSEVRSQYPDLAPVSGLDQGRQGMIDNLRDATEDDFDRRYLDQQKAAHEETRTLLEGYASHGDNPQLRSVALGALPMVERHLRSIGRIGAH